MWVGVVMKILILAHNAEGLYLPRIELMKQLKSVGYTLIVSIPKGIYYEAIEEIADVVVDTPIDRRGVNPVLDSKLIFFYWQIIRKYKPDCVLSYAIKPNLYGGLVSRLFGVPYMMNITGLGTAFASNGIVSKIATLFYRLVAGNEHCVFFQNVGNYNVLTDRGIKWRNPVFIPGSGVNLSLHRYEKYPENDDRVIFLFVSRIIKEKGIYELAEAAKFIRNKYNNVEFHVLGKCEQGYDSVVEKWNNDGIIVYHGHQSNVHEYLKRCHALIHPSYYPEGLSNVCIEAAATGRPVLTTNDIYGCKETIDDGITGYGFQSRNVESLISAVEKFLGLTNKKRSEMGIAGRKKMEKEFDRTIVVRAYMEEIGKLKD